MRRSPGALLAESGCTAIVVLAPSNRDPDLAPFAHGRRLGESLVVATRDSVRLATFSPLDRGEAAATGLKVFDPAELDVEGLGRHCSSPEALATEVVRRALKLCGVDGGTVALAGHGSSGVALEVCRALEADGRWRFVSGRDLLLRWRKRKGEHELAEVRRSARGVCEAFFRLAQLLAGAGARDDGRLWLEGEPLRVARLRSEIGLVLARCGLEQPEGNIIAPAEEGAIPHNIGSDERVLREGESLVVDIFPRGQLFADCTRTFCVGEPSPELRKAWEAAHETLSDAHRRSAAGVTGWELQQHACAVLETRGYSTPISNPGSEEGYVHGLGHGVGYELHEYPSFREHAAQGSQMLAVGDAFTLEPGLYQPTEGWAVRLEDLCVLGADGPENLTPLPYELSPRAWK